MKTTIETQLQSTRRPLIPFIGVLAAAFLLFFAMEAVQDKLPRVLFDFNTWFALEKDNPLYRFFWIIGDMTEAHYHKSLLGGIGVVAGSAIAWLLDRRGSRRGGTPICFGSGLWPWVFCASFLSLSISVVVFGGLRFEGDAWLPTFVSYVSVAAAIVSVYGGTLTNLLTGAVCGAFLTTPVALFLRVYICIPTGLPGVFANAASQCLGGIVAFELCKMLPWMKRSAPLPRSPQNPPCLTRDEKLRRPGVFLVRRILADFSEAMCAGNELAGGGLVLGLLISWLLNPYHAFYGTGWVPAMLLSQILTSGISIFVYWKYWTQEDYCPTFISLVSVAPAMVLTFGPSMFVIISGSILGALICPPLCNMLNRGIPGHWNPLIGCTGSMVLSTLFATALLRFLLAAFPILGVYS